MQQDIKQGIENTTEQVAAHVNVPPEQPPDIVLVTAHKAVDAAGPGGVLALAAKDVISTFFLLALIGTVVLRWLRGGKKEQLKASPLINKLIQVFNRPEDILLPKDRISYVINDGIRIVKRATDPGRCQPSYLEIRLVQRSRPFSKSYYAFDTVLVTDSESTNSKEYKEGEDYRADEVKTMVAIAEQAIAAVEERIKAEAEKKRLAEKATRDRMAGIDPLG